MVIKISVLLGSVLIGSSFSCHLLDLTHHKHWVSSNKSGRVLLLRFNCVLINCNGFFVISIQFITIVEDRFLHFHFFSKKIASITPILLHILVD